jgi:hypothetical protein
MATTFHGLYDLPQELTDKVFDQIAVDDHTVYCHTRGSAFSTSSMLDVSIQVRSDFISAVERRSNNHSNHRIGVDFNLRQSSTSSEIDAIQVSLPKCTTGVHLIVKVTRRGLFRTTPAGYEPNLGLIIKPLRTFLKDLNVKNLLIEIQLIDPTIQGPWRNCHRIKARNQYERLLYSMNRVDWEGENKMDNGLVRGAVLLHNSTGLLATPKVSTPDILHRTLFFTKNGTIKPRADALLDIFHATTRVKKALQSGPSQQIVSHATWSEDSGKDDLGPPEAASYEHVGAASFNHNAVFDKFDEIMAKSRDGGKVPKRDMPGLRHLALEFICFVLSRFFRYLIEL